MHSLTLFIPGLLLPAGNIQEQDIPPVYSLEKVLSCANRELLVPFTFSDALCMLFNLKKTGEGDYPIGAISRLVDDEHNTGGIWMRADPVHLAADQNGLILMDETTFTLDQHDALVLAADLRDIFSTYSIRLEVPRTNRWYIQLESLPAIKTTPLHEVIGKDIHPYLPSGPEHTHWVKLMNDIQMSMHANNVNDKRRNQNERSVNSLWLWGYGELPERKNCSWTRVFTDEEITRGFSIHAGVPCEDLTESLDDALDKTDINDDVLMVMSFGLRHSQYHDIKGWQDFICYLEEFWFVGLESYIKEREIEEFTLLTEYQQFTLKKPFLYKFWKKTRPLTFYAS